MRVGTLFSSGALVLVACGPSGNSNTDSVDGSVSSTDARDVADAGPCEDSVDVVFVLDVSSSMKFVLEDLEDNISSVVDAAGELAEDPHFGLVPYVDNFFIDDSGPLESGMVHTSADSLVSAFEHYRENYTKPNRNPGDGLDGPTTQNPICEENALDALYAAAESYPWRQRASRVIILATDDTFIEAPDNYGDRDGDGEFKFPGEGDYPALRTLQEATQVLKEQKIRVFSFTRLEPPGFFNLNKCSTPRRLDWSAISDGWSTPYNGDAPIPEQTDGRNYDLDAVRKGDLSLSETINEVVLESHCNIID
jgi:hypothetical protein